MSNNLLSRLNLLTRPGAAALLIVNLTFAVSAEAEVSTDKLPVLTGTTIHTITSEAVGDDFVLYVRVPPEAAGERQMGSVQWRGKWGQSSIFVF